MFVRRFEKKISFSLFAGRSAFQKQAVHSGVEKEGKGVASLNGLWHTERER